MYIVTRRGACRPVFAQILSHHLYGCVSQCPVMLQYEMVKPAAEGAQPRGCVGFSSDYRVHLVVRGQVRVLILYKSRFVVYFVLGPHLKVWVTTCRVLVCVESTQHLT